MNQLQIISHSSRHTEQVGALLGSLLTSGSFVALQGDLGGGKTCFTRGVVATAAPQSAHLVASPTYAIMNSYPGTPPVWHFDFYRLSGENEIAELGFEEYFFGNGICIVEWSERLGELMPPDHLKVAFVYDSENVRSITLTASGPESCSILQKLTEQQTKQNFL
ncbi:MAG TPA: tRNA (adenosine(37)-N6)-threonylcarbamoyltransferase complex ATPase subunit type 1 TsaE [Desulfuromonadales bacterium]|nr:tRNA (adenosine(37)-N6)-threonylcarbamoyltransferase complex ATPase subunit type 1 TsaE [Desulfuromonadales bacterium]